MAASTPPFIHRGFTTPKLKTAVFLLEGLNSLSTTYFFYYIYFYMREQFHFAALQNLLLAASMGLLQTVSAYYGGKFAQRYGYLTSVRMGAALMAMSFLVGSQLSGVMATVAVVAFSNMALYLTWPALEALMSEGEPRARLQSLVGIYNVVWAVGGAVAYFFGGDLLQSWGPKSIFYAPAAVLVVEAALTIWLEREGERQPPPKRETSLSILPPVGEASPIAPAVFLKMAWLANPLAYLTINTFVPTIPSIAARFHFAPRTAGFVCSIWMFVRAAAFIFLRLWPKWHYRFRFLAGSYLLMVVSFAGLLLARKVEMLVLAQIGFGLSIGLIYYSSLFYSMDVGETKGEHGGIHEAAIGLGNASGPGLAAGALAFFPESPGSATAAVCGLLVAGLGVLYWMRYRQSN